MMLSCSYIVSPVIHYDCRTKIYILCHTHWICSKIADLIDAY